MRSDDPFPELESERARLAFARACRDRMVERLSAVDPEAAADEITKEYVEVTVAEALDDLAAPGAGDFFGRIDEAPSTPSAGRGAAPARWYVGRRHIEDDQHDPVVVDWRAPIAAPFYRATGVDPLGLAHRRRFTMVDGDLTAYLDEHLDDPDAADVASGIPDPVLAEIGAARTGAMREIVATIQAEQDVVIRSPLDQCLVVQGGPGTGKTAVGLHRAAYLLFEHRRRLAREGVLVVGPNPVFLDYIANVLPSLGERNVRQCTLTDLCVPRIEITGSDDHDAAQWKGSADALAALEVALLAAVEPPAADVQLPLGARIVRFAADEIAAWVHEALDGRTPLNQRRTALMARARRELLLRTGGDEAWSQAKPLKDVLLKAWPTQRPDRVVDRLLLTHGYGPGGRRRAWTVADQVLVDEANSLLNGPPFTYGHVVVDEAQDHSVAGLRAIGRRSPARSLTILGDLAQSTTPAGQHDWEAVLAHLTGRDHSRRVVELTVGYRVPGPILDVANRLLPLTQVSASPSRSVRTEGAPPAVRIVAPDELGGAVAGEVRAVQHRHPLTGVVAPAALHERLRAALASAGLDVTSRMGGAAATEPGRHPVALFGPEEVKGLEFDGVVVVNPHEILDGTPRGARLLYVAMTRAVQVLHLVADAELPETLGYSAARPAVSPR